MKFKKYYKLPVQLFQQGGGVSVFSPNPTFGEAQLAGRTALNLQPISVSPLQIDSGPLIASRQDEVARYNTELNRRNLRLAKEKFEHQKQQDFIDNALDMQKALSNGLKQGTSNDFGIDVLDKQQAPVLYELQQLSNRATQLGVPAFLSGDSKAIGEWMSAMNALQQRIQSPDVARFQAINSLRAKRHVITEDIAAKDARLLNHEINDQLNKMEVELIDGTGKFDVNDYQQLMTQLAIDGGAAETSITNLLTTLGDKELRKEWFYNERTGTWQERFAAAAGDINSQARIGAQKLVQDVNTRNYFMNNGSGLIRKSSSPDGDNVLNGYDYSNLIPYLENELKLRLAVDNDLGFERITDQVGGRERIQGEETRKSSTALTEDEIRQRKEQADQKIREQINKGEQDRLTEAEERKTKATTTSHNVTSTANRNSSVSQTITVDRPNADGTVQSGDMTVTMDRGDLAQLTKDLNTTASNFSDLMARVGKVKAEGGGVEEVKQILEDKNLVPSGDSEKSPDQIAEELLNATKLRDRSGLVPLLGLINDTESQGDYNALLGFSNRADGAFAGTTPTSMTIKEIIDFTGPESAYGEWSKRWKEANNHGDPSIRSTPVGRYQIVGTEIARVAEKLGIDIEKTRFTPEVQDDFFNYMVDEALDRGGSLQDKMARLRAKWEGFQSVDDTTLGEAIQSAESDAILNVVSEEIQVDPNNPFLFGSAQGEVEQPVPQPPVNTQQVIGDVEAEIAVAKEMGVLEDEDINIDAENSRFVNNAGDDITGRVLEGLDQARGNLRDQEISQIKDKAVNQIIERLEPGVKVEVTELENAIDPGAGLTAKVEVSQLKGEEDKFRVRRSMLLGLVKEDEIMNEAELREYLKTLDLTKEYFNNNRIRLTDIQRTPTTDRTGTDAIQRVEGEVRRETISGGFRDDNIPVYSPEELREMSVEELEDLLEVIEENVFGSGSSTDLALLKEQKKVIEALVEVKNK